MKNDPVVIPIEIRGVQPFQIREYPIEVGIPFPEGAVRSLDSLALYSRDGSCVPCDLTETLRWRGGTLRWGLLRFLASGDSYLLRTGSIQESQPGIRITKGENKFEVDTGVASFSVSRQHLVLSWGSVSSNSQLITDHRGRTYSFRIDALEIEHHGMVSATLLLKGKLVRRGNRTFCSGECRISFWAGTALVRIEFTLWNQNAARHKGGLWDLGDPGSVFFRSLHFSFNIPHSDNQSQRLYLSVDPGGRVVESGSNRLSIHQGSSGGENWRSLAHVDRNNNPTPKFQGYREISDSSVSTGLRANPAVIYRDQSISAAFALEDFWQRFPSRLEIGPGFVSVEPFPQADSQEFELQGGEKATFRLWADFNCAEPSTALLPARIKAVPVLPRTWHCTSCGIPEVAGSGDAADPWFGAFIHSAVEGPGSFFQRRESYDEYGWRNFGDLPADHEQQFYRQDRPLISHYNNQYDLVQGFLTQFAGTGDTRWFELARDLARHVIDHDIYHTDRDKSAYNGGYFWHTAHYVHAGTATHRTYSRLAADPLPRGFGGGPANEHNYTTGLMYYFLLTGDVRAKEAVIGLATWVRNMQDGWKTPFRFLSRNETGLATCTADLMFQGPGRGAAYSVNACLDAFILTSDHEWIETAERFLRTCIHPDDDPGNMDLLNREARWSYVVFLQIVGKYLDIKVETGETGLDFQFARQCLLKYARWMAEAEYPYLERPEELEYPTSVWAAQELRKACVFLLAARYAASGEAALFREKGDYFFSVSRRYLESFEDRTFTRNMAIVLYTVPSYYRLRGLPSAVPEASAEEFHDFGTRPSFLPQKADALRKFKRIVKTFGLAGISELCRYLKDRARYERTRG